MRRFCSVPYIKENVSAELLCSRWCNNISFEHEIHAFVLSNVFCSGAAGLQPVRSAGAEPGRHTIPLERSEP